VRFTAYGALQQSAPQTSIVFVRQQPALMLFDQNSQVFFYGSAHGCSRE
jgi:hypothetical protein